MTGSVLVLAPYISLIGIQKDDGVQSKKLMGSRYRGVVFVIVSVLFLRNHSFAQIVKKESKLEVHF